MLQMKSAALIQRDWCITVSLKVMTHKGPMVLLDSE